MLPLIVTSLRKHDPLENCEQRLTCVQPCMHPGHMIPLENQITACTFLYVK